MEAFSEDWADFTADDERLLPVTVSWTASHNDTRSSEWGSCKDWGYDEGNDPLFDLDNVGRDAGSDLFNGSFSDQTTHAPSLSPRNLFLNDQGGSLHIPSEVPLKDDSYSGHDEVASPIDDLHAGLDDDDLGRYLSEGAVHHADAATGTSMGSGKNKGSSTSLDGVAFFDDLGSICGGHDLPSQNTDSAPNIDNTINTHNTTSTNTNSTINISNTINTGITIDDDEILVPTDNGNFGADYNELSIGGEEIAQQLKPDNLASVPSDGYDYFADEQFFDMPSGFQLASNGLEVGSSPEEPGSSVQNPLEIADDEVEDGFHDAHVLGTSAHRSSSSTTVKMPESRAFDFQDTEAPVFVSYAEVELIIPTPRKAISPVQPGTSKCFACLANKTSQEFKKLVSWRLQRGLYSCTGCYVGAGPVPNVLDEWCREKQRERRRRIAAEANGEIYVPGGGEEDVDAGPGTGASEAQSTASLHKRGASAMAGGSDSTEGTTKKARLTKQVANKTSEPIQRPGSPKRKMRGLGQPPAEL
ncbi:hypothetical protein NCU08264 [Neurospora crassa OR74A]|uniref:Uncharacterized protein n=1 Tax=Neurospora crassa (strain ATCC 24698 / 74-OR23-1A / CBS 708.71 / DSM 1257 / FGSC 987) TaxID=367110 RepID=Q7S078_NEUCR|nr:hypothetical protein NCU08264 [Neurospora crassa OR74A]EAA28710.2 hypothetical protein NCU08264 [Neurospora crassa OR74A]|eukprot:XP_957946.2 hypothetical protein NCU08264 [Neurospora crassa OR74A]